MSLSWPLRLAVETLRSGGLVAYPTEAVYGLGCDPLDAHAVARLWALKQRPPGKSFILLAAAFEQLEPYVALPGENRDKVLATWPGPVTWVVPAGPALPSWLALDGTVAVRVTAHPLSAALCRAFGAPIVSTSANRSGRPPVRTALQARRQFGGRVRVLVGATGGLRKPTPILDAVSGRQLR